MPESTTERITRIKETLLESEKAKLNEKLEDIFSICESEIEKLMLLQIYKYFKEFAASKYDDGFFTDINFILYQYLPDTPDEAISDKLTNIYLRNIYKPNFDGLYLSKYIGFSGTYYLTEGISTEKLNSDKEIYLDDLVSYRFEILPQQFGHIYGGARVDIAIILHRIKNNAIIETKKIAVECDGKEYHNNAEQIANDNRRDNELRANGWNEVFRVSGSSIYRINDKLKIVDVVFKEFFKALLK
jgi:hypothetical protein